MGMNEVTVFRHQREMNICQPLFLVVLMKYVFDGLIDMIRKYRQTFHVKPYLPHFSDNAYYAYWKTRTFHSYYININVDLSAIP